MVSIPNLHVVTLLTPIGKREKNDMNAITLNTKEFTAELEWIARFIERKTTIPVLSTVLFKKSGDFLELTSTDLEMGGITSMEFTGECPDFELTAPVHLLIKYLKKVEERTVRLVAEVTMSPLLEGPHPETCDTKCSCDLRQAVTNVVLRLEHGDDAGMNVTGMDAWSYPTLPTRPLATMQLGGLETAIPRTLIAISHEESRFTLNGALLNVKGTDARLISTDGHRLSMATLTTYDAGNVNVIIPKKALSELVRLGDSAFFCQDDNHVFFAVGQRYIIARKLTGSFPDYERVMPKDLTYATDVSVAPLRKVLDRVALFAGERSHAVLVTVNGSLAITAKQHEHGANGKVAIDGVRRFDRENGYNTLAFGLAVPYGSGFNAEYIAEFLKAAEASDVRFLFGKPTNAAEWQADGWRYVLMPMRDFDGTSEPCAVGDFDVFEPKISKPCMSAETPYAEAAA